MARGKTTAPRAVKVQPSVNVKKADGGYVVSSWDGMKDRTVVATNPTAMRKAVDTMLGGDKKK